MDAAEDTSLIKLTLVLPFNAGVSPVALNVQPSFIDHALYIAAVSSAYVGVGIFS